MHDKVEKYAPYAGAAFLLMVGLVAGLMEKNWTLAAAAVLFSLLAFFMLRYIISRKQSDKKGSGWSGPQDAPRPSKPQGTPPTRGKQGQSGPTPREKPRK